MLVRREKLSLPTEEVFPFIRTFQAGNCLRRLRPPRHSRPRQFSWRVRR